MLVVVLEEATTGAVTAPVFRSRLSQCKALLSIKSMYLSIGIDDTDGINEHVAKLCELTGSKPV